MEREEILEQIERLKKQLEELNSKIIDFELPNNYDKMSKEEKKAYHKKQEKLKKEALANLDNYSVIVDDHTIVKYPKNKEVARLLKKSVGGLTSIPLERDTFKRTTPEKFKELHKQNLEKIEKQIDRFNSTKAIRNDKIEFGPNFLNFAGTYFDKLECDNLEKETREQFLKKYDRQEDKNGNVIGDKFKFQNLTDDQRKDLIKIRIKAFAQKLNRKYEIAETKVKIDTKQKMNTYLENHGFFNDKTAFRNGTKKFTVVNSVISKSGVDMSKAKHYKSKLKSKGLESESREDKNKSRLIALNIMREKFDKFVKNYRGNGRQFSIEFENNFPEMAKKLYNQKAPE